MSTEYQFESLEFRQHIRALLYKYSVTHYTTNYITFTEDLVSELLQDLKPVPLTDPYSFVIPVDPFHTFSQIHAPSTLQPYDEILQTTNDARLYLKNLMNSTRGVPKTSRLEWTESAQKHLDEPFFPALTRHSRKQTPRLGKDVTGPDNYSALLKLHKVAAIAIEPIAEEKLDLEDILKVKHHIHPLELPAVKAVLKGTADSMRKQPSYKNKYLDPDFLCKIDLKVPVTPEEQFMPIFPRSRLPGSSAIKGVAPLPGLKSFADFPTVLDTDIQVENLDGDLSMQNLVLVSGWQAIQSSPPSTPSSRNSDNEDQVDQLFLGSSPDAEPPFVEEINKTRMDVLIPRSRQIGGKSGIMPHILAGKTLQTFLQPLLSHTKNRPVSNPETSTEERQALNMSPTSSSLLGQAASEIERSDAKNCSKGNNKEHPLDDELKKLYQGHSWDEVIMNEPLDDKQDLLMEVPTLPEPNVHPPNDMEIPKSFADFLVPASRADKHESNQALMKPEPCYQFLKKVKGKQSLGLALSWVPFTVDKRLPSVVELVGVADLFEHNTLYDGHVPQETAEKLLGLLDLSQDDGRRFSWREGITYRPVELPEDFQFLLNRQERQRIANIGVRLDDARMDTFEETELDKTSQSGIVPPSDVMPEDGLENERPNKRPRLELGHDAPEPRTENKRQLELPYPQDDYECMDTRYEDLVEDEHLTKRPRLEMYYESSQPDPNIARPLLPAYDEHEREHVDSGYESPGVFFSEENKENWPPLSSSSRVMEDECYQDHQTWNGHVEYDPPVGECQNQDDEGSFEPLSFDSRYPPSGTAQGTRKFECAPKTMKFILQEEASLSTEADTGNHAHVGASGSKVANNRDEFILEPDIASRSLGISSFAQLRARKVSEPASAMAFLPAPVPVAAIKTLDEYKGAPEDIFDQDTIVVSGPIATNLPVHRYMASLDFIQKHGVVRALRSEECAIELVERQTLGGVDLIVDPDCAVVFVSLFTLPARCATDVERVAQQSWKFSRLLVVFEAYPDNCSKKFKTGKAASASELYAYTPPILKAIKKFRRDINIADACGTKRTGTKIQYGFVDSVQDAALITRIYGCQAEERDKTFGVIWGERPWLSAEFIESEEQLLAGIKGMNHFSASMILSQITLEEYVDLVPEERIAVCSDLISQETLAECSADIESRFQAMSASSDML